MLTHESTFFDLTEPPCLKGFLITTDDIPVYFRWIEVIGPFKPIFSEPRSCITVIREWLLWERVLGVRPRYAFAIWGSRGDLECFPTCAGFCLLNELGSAMGKASMC